MRTTSPTRSASFHNTIAMAALTPRPTLAESLSACVLMFGPADVARSIGSNIACYPPDVTSEELHDAILDCLDRHARMGGAVADPFRCAQRLTTTFLRWHSQRQFAA
jgi:hypothetical protein